MSDTTDMTGAEFIRKVKTLAKDRGVKCEFVPERGKGSHGTLILWNPKDNCTQLEK